jgi:hypothetical protein
MGSDSLSDADHILRNGGAGQAAPKQATPPDAPPEDAERPTPRASSEASSHSGALRWGGAAIALLLLVVTGLGLWWSFQPAKFDVEASAAALTEQDAGSLPAGALTVSTVIRVADTLLHKPGGYMRNDVTPPAILMDNMTSWEYGVLTELRDSIRALRNDFSRSQTQSIENQDLKDADSKFNFDAEAWFLPSAEEEYNQGVEALQGYLDALTSGRGEARFYARADNLRAYLMVVEKRLGSYGQRLSASVGDDELLAALGAGEIGGETPSVANSGRNERTAWSEIDDVFFEARGYSWALLHMMKAIAVDFGPVLKQKNAEVSMQQIIRDLEYATVQHRSPMVLNGHGFGMLANHSLVLASYMSRANAAILDLRVLMERG